MTGSDRVFPPSNLPPGSLPWGRDVEEGARQDLRDVEDLKTNSLAGYNQVGAAAGAAATQLFGVRKYLYSLPSAKTDTVTSTAVSLPANTWTQVCLASIAIPAQRFEVTVLASANVNVSKAAPGPGTWMRLFPGSGTSLETPLAGVEVDNGFGVFTYNDVGQAATSVTYDVPARLGTVINVTLSLWNSSAVTLSGFATLNYALIYGAS